ncbi:hypothetical protein C1I98_31540 [Spongiactinospora gelatinilytica]|uniref:FAD-dependent urate hydroxylase HpyO/Asp monooxygenase CreE-like FAD/NAD(P)-binding domain-containing protein n=2 Tax=Spongiactinospora gelatinilytica TaxID=2666298 RepID=A0A2W2F3H2_9ACTN|nr:hypothetical protein C1I98_31540 [Spongiactinospora gelatinilytica]
MEIALVGAGAAAVGLLDALATTSLARVRPGLITVFEPSPHLWRGRPYGPDLDTVLVNAPPAIMSIRHGDPGHYAAWLGESGAAHLDDLLGQPLVPRHRYGDYLAATAEAALRTLRANGWRTRIARARVTGVERRGDRLAVVAADGGRYAADQVALCVGGGEPRDLYSLAAAPGYVHEPYPLARTLAPIPADARVAVLGSGLTAVDVVVSLAARGHTGPITMLSRSGLLPHVWQRPSGHRPAHVTAERVATAHREHGTVPLGHLIGLLRAELAEAGEDFDAFAADLLAAGTEDPVRRLRRQLRSVGDPRIGRRVLQETAHTVGPYAWRLLPESGRARLRRHFRLATSVASPMVPVNAATLLRLLDAGRLTLVPDVRAVEATGGGFAVTAGDSAIHVDAVVNAVNPPPQAVPRAAGELVASLVSGGLAAFHPAGGVVPADPRVQVAGDLAGGGPFITSGIPGIAAQAARTADAMLTLARDESSEAPATLR